MLSLEQRRVVTERVVAHFRGRAFSWTGRRTCVHLARLQARGLGHALPKLPDLRSELAAVRALKATGHETLEELFDSLFPRVAPAGMWLGDLALMDGHGRFDAIVVNAGGKVLGYHADHLERGLVPIEPIGTQPFRAAWALGR